MRIRTRKQFYILNKLKFKKENNLMVSQHSLARSLTHSLGLLADIVTIFEYLAMQNSISHMSYLSIQICTRYIVCIII